jgi:predicted metal-binding membrane protein
VGRLTALVGMGYFAVWTVLGVVAFPVGVAWRRSRWRQPMLARAVPIAAGAIVLIAGSLQLSAWKARHLACCREAPAGRAGRRRRRGLAVRPAAGPPLQPQLCGLTAILLVIGSWTFA